MYHVPLKGADSQDRLYTVFKQLELSGYIICDTRIDLLIQSVLRQKLAGLDLKQLRAATYFHSHFFICAVKE